MKTDKKQIAKIAVFITSIFVIFMSVSFAFINLTLEGTKRQVITAGTLSLELDEDDNNLTIQNALPVYDEVGMIQNPFTFRLINNGTTRANYRIKLVEVGTGTLKKSDVRYGLVKDGVPTIGRLSNITDGIIDHGTIGATLATIEYELRLWIKDSVTDNATINGKSLSYRVDVEIRQEIETLVINEDGTGANVPKVASGMIPVIYDDASGSWVKADVTNTNKSWFDYSTQKWANVVTVVENGSKTRSYYESAEVGTPIPMADINTMWVWIPRYSYSIKSENGTNYYGKGGTSSTLPGEIDIKFISTSEKDTGTAQYTGSTATNYLTMPGFTFGIEELSGIWVGKFETGGGSGNNTTTAESVLIKPDVQSWRTIQVSKAYQVGRNLQNQESIFGFNNELYDLDSHMMKNTEWSFLGIVKFSV